MNCEYRGNTWSRWFCVFHDDRTDIRRLWDPRCTMVNGKSSIVNGEALTCASLFSGYCGADHGITLAGFIHLWLCEIDKDCRRVGQARYPNTTIYEDITKFPADEAEMPDLLWLSPPCQDISIAGKREGLDGSRSRLFYAAIDIIRCFYDRGWRGVAVMEQVPRLLTSNRGRDFARVLEAFLLCGAADIAWRIMDSRYFDVAQRRERAYLVIDFGGERAQEILFEPESLRWNAQKSRKTRKEDPGPIADCLTGRPYSDRGSDNNIVGTLLGHHNRGCGTQPDQLVTVGTITASMANGNNGQDYDKLVYDNHPADSRITEAGELANTVKARYGTGGGNTPIVLEPVLCCSVKDSEVHTSMDIAPTLRSMMHKDGNPIGGGQLGVLVNSRVRRLTPTECLRLQGMPDDWCQVEGKPVSDSAIYRMAGNAVTSTVAHWIASRVRTILLTSPKWSMVNSQSSMERSE